jgi:hypothetical protein
MRVSGIFQFHSQNVSSESADCSIQSISNQIVQSLYINGPPCEILTCKLRDLHVFMHMRSLESNGWPEIERGDSLNREILAMINSALRGGVFNFSS